MILTKTPLRISFVGGGSDRPGFYHEEPGAVVAAAIDRYVYVAVNEKFDGSIRAAYSQTENVTDVASLQHDLVRAALIRSNRTAGVEIHSIADLPAGTGLGSSSSFTVGLLAGLAGSAKLNPDWLARQAVAVELSDCQKPIGKQDQYAAAFGGVRLYGFQPSETVTIAAIETDYEALSAHCLLLDTGLRRQGDAGATLASQQQDHEDVQKLATLAPEFAARLRSGNLNECGWLMHVAWTIKGQFINDPQIDRWYAAAMLAGAWGGKLCGAGGGGFLLFLAPPDKHAAIAQATGLRRIPIRVGVPGCQVVYP